MSFCVFDLSKLECAKPSLRKQYPLNLATFFGIHGVRILDIIDNPKTMYPLPLLK